MWVKGELFDDFDAAANVARGALDRAEQLNMFDRLEWFKTLWHHCPPGKAPLIARARAENCDTWLFLARTEERSAISLGNWYSLAFRPIFSGQPSDALQRGALTAIARRLSAGLTTITLSPVPEDDGTADLIVSAFAKGGWTGFKKPKTGSWITRIEGKSFADYWAERPGEVRNTHDRKLKKFGVTTQIFTQFDEAAWAEYESIYGDSWKGEEGSPSFLRALAEMEGAAGTLRLGIARHEGEAIAAQLWTIENGRAIIHKLAYREDKGEMSAGTILSAAMFRHAIDIDTVKIIDYGTGDDRYKQSWMTERQQLSVLTFHNPKTPSGLFRAVKAGVTNLVSGRRGG
jgi:Acetyltransferase (GNAT) domain